MSLFPNVKLELFGYVDSKAYDDYGQKLGSYIFREIVSADIQPMSPEDTQAEFGKILKDTYKIYLDVNVQIEDTDVIRIDDDTYVIVGSPSRWTHGIVPHTKIVVQRQRIEGELPL